MAAQGLRSITVPCSTSYPCERGLRRAAAVRVRACRAESMVMTDNHSILGVRRNASRNEIKRAYRRLARLYHPDVCKDRESEQRFKQINRAYEVNNPSSVFCKIITGLGNEDTVKCRY